MPAAAQHREQLLEELDRDVAAAGELADRDRAVAARARASSARARRAYGDLVVIESTGRPSCHHPRRHASISDAPLRPAAAADGADLLLSAPSPTSTPASACGTRSGASSPHGRVRRCCGSCGGARSATQPRARRRDHARLRGQRRVPPDVRRRPPRLAARRADRRAGVADRDRLIQRGTLRRTATTSRWSSSCGSPETVTVPTTPTPRTEHRERAAVGGELALVEQVARVELALGATRS